MVGGFGKREFYVAQVPRVVAVEMIRTHHYSRRVVNNSYVHLGVWVAGQLLGVLQYGYALNPARADKVVAGTDSRGYLELNRMWLDDAAPRNSESRAISYSFRYIRKVMPQVKWVQSFADERCGRWGVVYQAANFLYVGSHKTVFWELDGETYHDMLLTAHVKGGNRGRHLRDNLTRATKHTFRQFRYVYFLDKRAMTNLRLPIHPYPKPGGME
ncbi:MAG: hypothetical protein HQL56_13520 [Magnetococcales bacterium]|nr:hypothetical protein [Magnetococcales bacterium]